MKLSFYSTKGYEYEPHLQTLRKQTQSNPILKGAPVPPCGDAGQAGGYKMLAKLAKIGKNGMCKGNFFERKKDAA